jgi:hypothetical protein
VRAHLTRFHGVFAPHSKLRAAVTPAGRGPGAHSGTDAVASAMPRHAALTWARRLKRVFNIEIESCACCGGRLKVIASIEDPEVIARILAHPVHGPALHPASTERPLIRTIRGQ